MEGYSLERLLKELDEGYQIIYVYMDKKYLIYKTSENCYTQELLTIVPKNPLPVFAIITLKRIEELFPFMEEIEYKSFI